MNASYADITSRLGKPIWYDECGVPRYDPFKPDDVNNIYADEAALLTIECQDCAAKFLVALTCSPTMDLMQPSRLSDDIKQGVIHYGDPPHHDCVGDTMNCFDLSVMQFWNRPRGDWGRVPELEGPLPDTRGDLV